ncbi:MAG: rhomboid family intramembrane serine protease [Candidatus Methylacidiphilales bacterium]
MVFGGYSLRGTWTRRIIIANILVALAGLLLRFFGRPDYIMEFGALFVPDLLRGWLWQPLTYMWIHAQPEGLGVLHILFNMLTLAAFGPVVERNLGPKHFWRLYLLGGLVSGLFFAFESMARIIFGLGVPLPLVGASGAVLAICAAFAWMFPEARLFVLFIPVPIKARTVVIGAILVSMVLMLLDPGSFIAHSAHLGGLLFGVAYMWRLTRTLERLGYAVREPAREVPITVLARVDDPLEGWDQHRLELEADRVLEKISRYGLGALTERDRDVLERVRRR